MATRKTNIGTKKAKRVALYMRVSTTNGQTVENQRLKLNEIAKRAGWDVVGVYADEGISGVRGRDMRPAFDHMLKDATHRKFDMIATTALDRIGRSMKHLVEFIETIKSLEVGLYIHDQAIDTTTPAGELFFNVASAFATFERALIQERVKAGLQRAKANGKKLGRPYGWTVDKRKNQDEVLKLRAAGISVRNIAKALSMSTHTVQRIMREAREASE
jgi:DNA invertase Pin-like site-specific DNA recombinase